MTADERTVALRAVENVPFATSFTNALRVSMSLKIDAARISNGSRLSFGPGLPIVSSPINRFDLSCIQRYLLEPPLPPEPTSLNEISSHVYHFSVD